MELRPPASDTVPPYPDLQNAALQHHPQVLRALAAYAQAEQDLALEIAVQYPALRLAPGYLFDQGDHVWSLVGGIVVPLFANHKAAIASAAAARDTAREHFYAVQTTTIAELQSAYANWQAAQEVWTAAQAIAAEIARSHTELVSAQAQGSVDRLSVTRVALQQAEINQQVALSEARAQQDFRRLETAARTPLGDAAFARYLSELAAFELPAEPP